MPGASCCRGPVVAVPVRAVASLVPAGLGRAQKWVQPVGPSYAAPSTVTPEPAVDRADHLPAVGERRPGEGRQQRVVVPPAEDELDRVGAERGADGLERLGDLERVAAYVDRDAGRRRRRGRPRRADRRRRRSSRWRRPRRPAGPRRTAARGGGRPRPAPAATGSRGRGPRARRRPSPAARSARARRRARRPSGGRVTAVHEPSDRDRDHHLVGRRQVAADDAGAHERALLGEAAGRSPAPTATGRSRGAASPIVSEWPRPPIALTSERFAAAARWPMSCGGCPVAAEVPALDEHVGGHHDVPVADPQHRGVVAGTDQHLLALGKSRGGARSAGTRRPRTRWRQLGRTWRPSHQIRAAPSLGRRATCRGRRVRGRLSAAS